MRTRYCNVIQSKDGTMQRCTDQQGNSVVFIESSGFGARKLLCSKSLANCKNIISLLSEVTLCSNESVLKISFEQQKKSPIVGKLLLR